MHDVVHTFHSSVASILLISFAVSDFGKVLTSSPTWRLTLEIQVKCKLEIHYFCQLSNKICTYSYTPNCLRLHCFQRPKPVGYTYLTIPISQTLQQQTYCKSQGIQVTFSSQDLIVHWGEICFADSILTLKVDLLDTRDII